MHEFPGPHERIRRILDNALVGCTYVASQAEDGGLLVLEARRSDGRSINIRFRGVRESEMTSQPDPGAILAVKSVRREGLSLASRFFPLLKPPGPMYARVRIDAGPATLDIVCQDAEWWEE